MGLERSRQFPAATATTANAKPYGTTLRLSPKLRSSFPADFDIVAACTTNQSNAEGRYDKSDARKGGFWAAHPPVSELLCCSEPPPRRAKSLQPVLESSSAAAPITSFHDSFPKLDPPILKIRSLHDRSTSTNTTSIPYWRQRCFLFQSLQFFLRMYIYDNGNVERGVVTVSWKVFPAS